MAFEPRLLDRAPVVSLDEYKAGGGCAGLEAARAAGPLATVEALEASGLRGRGGAGFPAGAKWRTVLEYESPVLPPTVVVNAAEGEPGSFKDRTLLRVNPYRVLEGALIGAAAVGARRVIVAIKASFERERERLEDAATQLRLAGITAGIEIVVFRGPSEYLYGEETALLEVIDGRHPFPRVAPPFRHGVDEIGDGVDSAAQLEMADESGTVAPPALVSNAETFANVPGILREGPEWFRGFGTERSPGTVVCTITGRTHHHGVGEVPMGTPLSDVIEIVGGGALRGSTLTAAMSGVANPLLPADALTTPLTYEDMEAAGSGLGACGFIVFDDTVDLAAVAAGVSRFLGVESCGQCTPCKRDGLALADRLADLVRDETRADTVATIRDLVGRVSERARCNLASQQERVVGSVLARFPDVVESHAARRTQPTEPELIAPIIDIVEGLAQLDEGHADKLPDWSYGDEWSGKSPADLIDVRAGE